MKRFRSIVAGLLLVLWIPASSHALLEWCDLIHQRHVDHTHENVPSEHDGSHEHNSGGHDAADGRVLASSGINLCAKVVAMPDVIPPLLFLFDFCLIEEIRPLGPAPPGTAPPELKNRWQFFFRTALPVRAPSLHL